MMDESGEDKREVALLHGEEFVTDAHGQRAAGHVQDLERVVEVRRHVLGTLEIDLQILFFVLK